MIKKLIAGVLASLLCLAGLAGAVLAAPDATQGITDLPFDLTAKSGIVIDATGDLVLAGKNAHEKLPIASVTKVMTLLLVMEAIDRGQYTLQDEVLVSSQAAGMGGSQALIDAGGVYTVSALIKSIIIASANDSSVAMAEYTFGSQEAFVMQMNQRAVELGMNETYFVNCTGLPAEGHYSTAYDVALMSRELGKHDLFFEYSSIWTDEIEHKNGRVTMLSNTNKLLRTLDGCDGLKTGSTNEAKFCMSATARRGAGRFIAVVLGAPSSQERFDDAAKLINFAFANFNHVILFEPGDVVYEGLPVTGGQSAALNAVTTERVVALVPKAQQTDVEAHVNLPQRVSAPVQQGEYLGDVQVYVGGWLQSTHDLVSDSQVLQASFWDCLKKVISQR